MENIGINTKLTIGKLGYGECNDCGTKDYQCGCKLQVTKAKEIKKLK